MLDVLLEQNSLNITLEAFVVLAMVAATFAFVRLLMLCALTPCLIVLNISGERASRPTSSTIQDNTMLSRTVHPCRVRPGVPLDATVLLNASQDI